MPDVEIWLSPESVNEASRMVRPWYSWPVLLIGNLQGIAVFAVLIFGGCSLVFRSLSDKLEVLELLAGLGLVIAPMAFGTWLYRREKRKEREELAMVNPLRIAFTGEGLHTYEKNGASSFVPWSLFDGYREGKTVILLRRVGSKEYRPIPKRTEPPAAVEGIRSVIRSQLPELS